ncbi:unnamed protein product [Closterium sp. Naga37s-1]|nr:unnamed protein product [Closterium sp. Naga37s-1]
MPSRSACVLSGSNPNLSPTPPFSSLPPHLSTVSRRAADVYEGCQDRIGEDPRAIPPRNDLHTCTLVPRIGKRKTVTVATTVKKGDCLWGISRQLTGTGTNWKDIVNENRQYFKKAKFDTPIDDDLFIIQPGWKLKMPVTAPPPPED